MITHDRKKVRLNGLCQNCYILDVRNDVPLSRSIEQPKKYEVLEKKNLPNGFTYEIVQKDYPITPESVSSYIDSSDYRLDPAQAIENAPKRVNLGDISQVQEFIADNPIESAKQYASILQKVADYYKAQAEAKSTEAKSINSVKTQVNQGQSSTEGDNK